MPLGRILGNRWSKITVFGLCTVPGLLLAWKAFAGDLGANPIEFITHWTGDWTIRLLCITLSITPLRKLLGLSELIRFRRMLGLFAFFYASLHFLTWFVVGQIS
jgi:sulfoxide reductase heme-binding subunit YedZ